MTLPVSTSGGRSCLVLIDERDCGAVLSGVVGHVVEPASPDDADPGSGEYADGVWVVFAGCAGSGVDVGGPRAFVSTVVSKGRDSDTESFVAGPPEVHGLVFAGRLGDRCASGKCGDGVGAVVGLAAVAPLGEYLGGVDLTRPWQRREGFPSGCSPSWAAIERSSVLIAVLSAVKTPTRAVTASVSAGVSASPVAPGGA